MKKTICYYIAIWFLFGTYAMAQNSVVPSNVEKAFLKKYTNITPYMWEVNESAAYAFFEKEKEYKYCRLTLDGTITETGRLAEDYEMPSKFQNTFNNYFSELDIANYYSVELLNGEKRMLILADDINFKYCIMFSLEGEILRNEQFDFPEVEDYNIEYDESEGQREDDW